MHACQTVTITMFDSQGEFVLDWIADHDDDYGPLSVGEIPEGWYRFECKPIPSGYHSQPITGWSGAPWKYGGDGIDFSGVSFTIHED